MSGASGTSKRMGPEATRFATACVATPHYLASHAGAAVLRSGGNAMDAAIAANLVLGSVAPYTCGLGGDCFAIVVEPDGSAHTADEVGPLLCANGIAISSDGTKVYTAEVMAQKLTVIDRAADGSLSNPRLFASCPFLPDGIGLDEEGGVWAAMPGSGYVARFTEEGMTDAIPVPLENGVASACLLGGPDRTTLYMTVGVEVFDFDKSAREALGTIWVADVSSHGGDTRP